MRAYLYSKLSSKTNIFLRPPIRTHTCRMIFTLFSVTSFGVTQLSQVFCGCPQGLKPEVRKEAWKYLLGFYPFDLTDIERMELRESKEKEYWTMKNQWQSFTEDQERRFTKWREVKHLISKPPTHTLKHPSHCVATPEFQT